MFRGKSSDPSVLWLFSMQHFLPEGNGQTPQDPAPLDLLILPGILGPEPLARPERVAQTLVQHMPQTLHQWDQAAITELMQEHVAASLLSKHLRARLQSHVGREAPTWGLALAARGLVESGHVRVAESRRRCRRPAN